MEKCSKGGDVLDGPLTNHDIKLGASSPGSENPMKRNRPEESAVLENGHVMKKPKPQLCDESKSSERKVASPRSSIVASNDSEHESSSFRSGSTSSKNSIEATALINRSDFTDNSKCMFSVQKPQICAALSCESKDVENGGNFSDTIPRVSEKFEATDTFSSTPATATPASDAVFRNFAVSDLKTEPSTTTVPKSASHYLDINPILRVAGIHDTDTSPGIDTQLILSLAAAAKSTCSTALVNGDVKDQNDARLSTGEESRALLRQGGTVCYVLHKTASGASEHMPIVATLKEERFPSSPPATDARTSANQGTVAVGISIPPRATIENGSPFVPTAAQRTGSTSVDRSILASKLLAKRLAASGGTTGTIGIVFPGAEASQESACRKVESNQCIKHETAAVKLEFAAVKVDVSSGAQPKRDSGPYGSGMSDLADSRVKSDESSDFSRGAAVLEVTHKGSGISKGRRDGDGRRTKTTFESSGTRTVDSDWANTRSERASTRAHGGRSENDAARRRSRKDGDTGGNAEDQADKKLSRDERKFRSILRQIEMMEKKQPGIALADDSPRRANSWETEVELPSNPKRRKEQTKDEMREKERERERPQEPKREKDRRDKDSDTSLSKKRPVPAREPAATVPPPAESAASKKSAGKGPAKPASTKAVGKGPPKKHSKGSEDRGVGTRGPLVILREFKKAARKTAPCLPRVLSAVASAGAQRDEKTGMLSRKAHLLGWVALESSTATLRVDSAETAVVAAETVTMDASRLNPFRRAPDKRLFPVTKRLLSQWKQYAGEEPFVDDVVSSAAHKWTPPHEPAVRKPSPSSLCLGGGGSAADVDGDGGVCEMDLDQPSTLEEVTILDRAPPKPVEKECVEGEMTPVRQQLATGISTASAPTASSNRVFAPSLGLVVGSSALQLAAKDYRPGSPPLSPLSSEGVPSRLASPMARCPAGGSPPPRPSEPLSPPPHGRPLGASERSASPRPRLAWEEVRMGTDGRDRDREREREPKLERERERDRDRHRDWDRDRDPRVQTSVGIRDASLHRERPAHRDASPVLRRRSPPRTIFTSEPRRSSPSGDGGLSRESLRRERQQQGGLAPCATSAVVCRPGTTSSGGPSGGCSMVRDRQIATLGGKQWAAELGGGRGQSPPGRPSDRSIGGGGSGSSGRDRSLSPRSKEALREIQLARDRRAKDLVGADGDAADLDLTSSARWVASSPAAVRVGDPWWSPGGLSRAGYAAAASSLGLVRGGGPGPPLPPGRGGGGGGGLRRERPSMFDHRRGR